MTRIKICGITNQEDADTAVKLGANALGFIFHRKSPRYISPSKARKIIGSLPPMVTPVGVFVDLKEGAVKDISKFTSINTLQFHGDEEPAYCKRFAGMTDIKAFRVEDSFNFNEVKKYKVDAYLFDTYSSSEHGGTGKAFNWDLLKYEKIDKPYILSGGLNPDNVAEAINLLNPFGVDVSSGVEKTPGKKDFKLIEGFISAVSR